MGYSAADESFTHQLPTTFDQVHDPDPTWSDRCYFFAASPDGTMLLASGYGNNPNTATGLGYVKVSLADGRHWDLLSGRPVTGDDRGDLSAGPMRWTCVEPLKRWRLDVEPNKSGIEWELYYEPTAPMWELLPMKMRGQDGQIYFARQFAAGILRLRGERAFFRNDHAAKQINLAGIRPLLHDSLCNFSIQPENLHDLLLAPGQRA